MSSHNKDYKKIIFTVLGIFLTIGGTALVFKDWERVVVVFRGTIGALLAVIGLGLLYIASSSQSTAKD